MTSNTDRYPIVPTTRNARRAEEARDAMSEADYRTAVMRAMQDSGHLVMISVVIPPRKATS